MFKSGHAEKVLQFKTEACHMPDKGIALFY